MHAIRNRDGEVVSQSRNLRGIRAYVGKHIIKTLDVSRVGNDEGLLSILFENGDSYQCPFASFDVLCMVVRSWRNVHGAPILVNGVECGKASKNNPK